MSNHPTPQRLREWYEGQLDEADSAEIFSHVETCEQYCLPLLARLSQRTEPLASLATSGVPASIVTPNFDQ